MFLLSFLITVTRKNYILMPTRSLKIRNLIFIFLTFISTLCYIISEVIGMELFLLGIFKTSTQWYENSVSLVMYIVVPLVVGYWASGERVKKFENKLKRKGEQASIILKLYKKMKIVEEWGNRVPSEYSLQRFEYVLDETAAFLYENEFYIPNNIYKKCSKLLNKWGEISDKYSQYLKGKKGEIEYHNLEVDKDVKKLLKKRVLLEKSIKKLLGYT